MTTSNIQVALPWHALGHGNLGVDALTRANIAILRAAARRVGRGIEFVTLCSGGSPDNVPDDVTIGPLPRLKPLLTGRSDFLAALRSCDLVVDIGEGDSWTDIYGGRRFLFQAGTKAAAMALGKPLVLAPQTIGPFETPWRAKIANAVMNRATAVFSRDQLSTAYLVNSRMKAETAEFIDVAFRLPFTQRAKPDDGRTHVGINVSGLLYNGGYSGANELDMKIDYAQFTRELIAHFLGRPETEVYLIPHVSAASGRDDDRSAFGDLQQRFPAVKALDVFPDASVAKSFMSGLDFVVGGRMHACIGAFSARVPVVPIAYSRKFNGLFDTLGYRHYVDGKAVQTDQALAATLAAFDNRERLARDIDAGLGEAHRRLDAYEERLATILGTLT